jgi:AAA domain, putative AbiEii toxin, Type IV TA system
VQKLSITAITSNAGDTIYPAKPGVTCFVGANNVGKSQVLRDLLNGFESPHTHSIALGGVVGDRPALVGDEDLEDWLVANSVRSQPGPGGAPQYISTFGGQALSARDFRNFLLSEGWYLGPLRPWFYWSATAGGLSGLATGSLGAGPGMAGTSPLAMLYRDGSLEQELCRLAEQSFGASLTLDRINADVRLRVGRVDSVEVPRIDNPTVEYADAVSQLPSFEQQGDGIKSFIGLALMVITSRFDLIVIDEPEAFLHPPQAKALGRWLAHQAHLRGVQILVATHDRDFVLGLLEAANEDPVTIVRVTRRDDDTHFRQLTADELNDIWSDPVLRYSNVLQGLFYDRVCVCEADADCRFYAAVLDAMADATGTRTAADNVMFVPSGGKQRIASLASPLTSLGVKSVAIADFDVLNNRATLQSIVESVGGEWTDTMNADYVTMADALNRANLWSVVKTVGLAVVPSGPPNTAAFSLLSALRKEAVLVVPVGELEGFDRTIGVKGAAWVSAMLEDHRHQTNDEARQLVGEIVGASIPGSLTDNAVDG